MATSSIGRTTVVKPEYGEALLRAVQEYKKHHPRLPYEDGLSAEEYREHAQKLMYQARKNPRLRRMIRG